MRKAKVIQERGAKRREQILIAAIDLIRDGGLDNFSIANLAQRGGISLSTMYQYYKSIDDVLFDAMRRVSTTYHEQIEYALSTEGDAKTKIVAFIETNFRSDIYSLEFRMVWLAFWAKAPFEPRLQKLSLNMQVEHHKHLAQILTELGVDGDVEADAFWTFIDGLWLHGTFGKGALTATKALGLAYTYVERMLGISLRLVKK
ncbi:MAG TPA: TetR family transcriptional regulator C-terminal domain-containing protein [Alphaproteobacteria bacterium]|nr:TetR family transcriptional regulator C-terminal domain-containing protein [Alphaproteobacteria bacterium]